MLRRTFLQTVAAIFAGASPALPALAPAPREREKFVKDLKIGERFWRGGKEYVCVDHGPYTKKFLELEKITPEFNRGESYPTTPVSRAYVECYAAYQCFGDKTVSHADGSPTYQRPDVPGYPGVTFYESWMGPICPINDSRFNPI